jgi:serine/threonine protein kinase
MAPEQKDEARRAGPAADLYGLAATFFFALTREVPRAGFRSLRALRPEVSRELDAVVRRCLAEDPRERFVSAKALEDAFTRAR